MLATSPILVFPFVHGARMKRTMLKV